MKSERFVNMAICLLLASKIPYAYSDENSWSTNGPFEANVMSIAVDPHNNQHILLGTLETGLYRSINGGVDWQRFDIDSLQSGACDILFHPEGPDTIYAATIRGLYKSTDRGINWINIGPSGFEYDDMRDIEIHNRDPRIMAVTGYAPNMAFITLDGGHSWRRLDFPLFYVRCIRFDPLHPDTLFLATQSARVRMSIFRSEDLGQTWIPWHGDLDTLLWGYDLQLDPVHSKTMYFCGHSFLDIGPTCIEKTTDGGESWFDITPPGLLLPFAISITISPLDHNIVYVCTNRNGILKSTNGGQTWQEINSGILGRRAYKVVVDSSTGYLYAAITYGGIYRSTNSGQSWQKISQNISHAYCRHMAVNPRNPDSVYVSTMSGALYRSTDGARNWQMVDLSFPYDNYRVADIEFDHSNPANIFFTYYRDWGPGQGGVCRSTNGGQTWTRLTDGLPADVGYYSIVCTPFGSGCRLLTASPAGLFKSDNYGDNWQRSDSGLPSYALPVMIASSRADPGLLFLADYQAFLFRSTDYGESWAMLAALPGQGSIRNIVCSPLVSGLVYLCRYGTGLFKSTDSGTSWISANGNLPGNPQNMNVSGIAINPFNSNNIYVNSHPYGVFESHDGGQSWSSFSQGLELLYYDGMIQIAQSDSNRLYLGTDLQSVWAFTRTPSFFDPPEKPQQIALGPNYPNPFNASTVISYFLPAASPVNLDIYDLLGRKLVRLYEGNQPAGEHSLRWDASGMATGIYFYRLSAGDEVRFGKALLVR